MATTKETAIQKLIYTQIKRQNLDISNWRKALKAAEQKAEYHPRRYSLYDIYNEIILDTHLSSVIDKRKKAILNARIEFVRNGVPDEKINEQLRSPWFLRFLNDLLDTEYWGFSVFQFFNDATGWINYDLIPRKHVSPEEGLILRRQEDSSGELFESFPNLVTIGNQYDLGLLNKIAPMAIYKRNCMADLAQYSELYGQPIKEATYDGLDETIREKLLTDLTEIGSSPVIIHPDGTKINILDTLGKGTTTTLFQTCINLYDQQISKAILGNVLTTDSGANGSRSLGEVQQESEVQKQEADRIFVLNTLNYNLADIFNTLGFNTQGGLFSFVKNENIDLTTAIEIDMKLSNLGVPLDDDYFYTTYGRPKPANYDALKSEMKAKQVQQQQPTFSNKADEPYFSGSKKTHLNAKPKNIWQKGADFFG
jgi:phage gp29-like protein